MSVENYPLHVPIYNNNILDTPSSPKSPNSQLQVTATRVPLRLSSSFVAGAETPPQAALLRGQNVLICSYQPYNVPRIVIREWTKKLVSNDFVHTKPSHKKQNMDSTRKSSSLLASIVSDAGSSEPTTPSPVSSPMYTSKSLSSFRQMLVLNEETAHEEKRRLAEGLKKQKSRKNSDTKDLEEKNHEISNDQSPVGGLVDEQQQANYRARGKRAKRPQNEKDSEKISTQSDGLLVDKISQGNYRARRKQQQKDEKSGTTTTETKAEGEGVYRDERTAPYSDVTPGAVTERRRLKKKEISQEQEEKA